MKNENRRRFDRVHLIAPLPAVVGGQRAFILDVSLMGLRVTHQQKLEVNAGVKVDIEWEGERVVVDCRVVRTHSHRSSPTALPVYHSGLEMVTTAPALVRALIEWHIVKALDEQKANARGVPPMAAQSFQTGKGKNYMRHELMGGEWRVIPTTDPRQPRMGFTVSASTTKEETAMLRETFERGDRSAREMLQKMAELSISTAEGIPTRKYEP